MYSFSKDERLCAKKSISRLLAEGNKYFHPSFSVKWMELETTERPSIQLLAIVPKRNFKKAVDRNKIKRFIRESFRLNKELLAVPLKEKNKNIALMLLYNSRKIESYQEVESKITLILQFLASTI
ncbi:MAG TPA: ribonuclease P protein component [Bacteroidales bacterium]|nr:ribonuclease P protein component [Bacteroidales bacterium]